MLDLKFYATNLRFIGLILFVKPRKEGECLVN